MGLAAVLVFFGDFVAFLAAGFLAAGLAAGFLAAGFLAFGFAVFFSPAGFFAFFCGLALFGLDALGLNAFRYFLADLTTPQFK